MKKIIYIETNLQDVVCLEKADDLIHIQVREGQPVNPIARLDVDDINDLIKELEQLKNEIDPNHEARKAFRDKSRYNPRL